jgi:carboxypeptidase family protein
MAELPHSTFVVGEGIIMRTALAVVVALSMFIGTPLVASGAARAQAPASVSGTATSSTGQTLANTVVRLRNVSTGQIAGSTTSTATGEFKFDGLPAGLYTVEVVSAAGQIVGTSAAISVATGATVTGVVVSATAAAAAAGAAAAGAAAAAGSGISTVVIVTTAAAAAGIAGAVVVATRGNASPSR